MHRSRWENFEQLCVFPASTQMNEVPCREVVLDQRMIKGLTVLKENLLSELTTYRPYGDLVQQTRILLLGPVGAGKSSFVNSVKSIFGGHVVHQALVGCDANGTSEKYRTYSVMFKHTGKSLPFVLCDSLGLSQRGGLCVDDVNFILKGHTPDRYQFNSMKPITSSHPNYIHHPQLQDRIHCVAFVFDVRSVERLSEELVTKIKSIRREMIKCGMLHLVLLTHADSLDSVTRGDFRDIYDCEPVKLKIEAVHKLLGFALSDILVVSNYVSEWELDPAKDVLLLSALRQMLWTTDDFLEDLPLEQTAPRSKELPSIEQMKISL